jgi:hypothetical protein
MGFTLLAAGFESRRPKIVKAANKLRSRTIEHADG